MLGFVLSGVWAVVSPVHVWVYGDVEARILPFESLRDTDLSRESSGLETVMTALCSLKPRPLAHNEKTMGLLKDGASPQCFSKFHFCSFCLILLVRL